MEKRRKRIGDDLAHRLIRYAARIGKVVDAIPDTRLGRHIAGQLVRCGTSPAPNYAEARGSESKKGLHPQDGDLRIVTDLACLEPICLESI